MRAPFITARLASIVTLQAREGAACEGAACEGAACEGAACEGAACGATACDDTTCGHPLLKTHCSHPLTAAILSQLPSLSAAS